MRKKIIIFGCGGHARSIISAIREKEPLTEIILVDEYAKQDEIIMGCTVCCNYELQTDDCYFLGVGNNEKRKEKAEHLEKKCGGILVSIFSEYAVIRQDARIESGVFIGANAYVGPQTKIGRHTIINTSSVVEHEAVIGNYVHIAPNATICGKTKIGDGVFCGAGCTVIDNINVCDHTVIGAGAVVIQNIVTPGTYIGVPARRIY